MKTMLRWSVAALVALTVAARGGAADDDKEEKIPLEKVPKAVLDAVKAKFPKAKLVSAEKEKEDGKVVYEINIKDGGKTVEVTVTPEGKIVSVEKTIAEKDLPEAVTEAFKKKYPGATVKLVEEVTKGDKVYFELQILTKDKKKLEVEFDPKGKFLKEEKKGDEKKEEKKEGK
jgi:uncharacterized membrane protein YkoI